MAGNRLAALAAVVLVALFPVFDCSDSTLTHISRVVVPRVSPSAQAQTVAGLIQRVLGKRCAEFKVIVDPGIGPKDKDTFKVESRAGGHVTVTGTSGVAAAMGFHYYVTQYAGGHVSWAGTQVNLPSPLPEVPSPGETVTSNDRFRYYLNTCAMSYSFVWFDWASWEEQLDWMAMHAINLPLAFVGQEAIWQRVYLKMGFTQAELDLHFAGPAFLAWQRMGNMHGWGGPLPQSWIHNEVQLQHKILQRMRDFGMTPVLPAFAGHVPENITRLFPNVSVTHAGDWAGFNKSYCCNTLLDFSDPLFGKIGKSFIQEYTREFGTDHVYNCDTFNENTPPKGDPAFIASAGRKVYEGMVAADPDAIWLMQGWLFSHDTSYWTLRRAKALLTSVPQGRMIVLDMPSDIFPQYARLDSYFGQPFVWTMLHNFGGNLAMYGILPTIATAPFAARNFRNSSMVGVGLTMEGIFQNDVMYEFMMEHTWRKEPWNISQWITNYHTKRYGTFNADVDFTWQILKATVYNCTDKSERHGHGRNLIVRRPRRNQRIDRTVYFESHGTDVIMIQRPYVDMGGQQVWYDPNDLFSAWDHMVSAAPGMVNSTLFRYDLVDVSRQSLQVLAIKFYTDLNNAFKAKDLAETRSRGAALVELVLDMDRVLATDPHFLLGRWVESAKRKGTTPGERALYEYNARNQLTLWGPNANILDYANKQWAGLMSDYYGARWKRYVAVLLNLLQTGQKYNRSLVDYELFTKVETPFTYSRKLYPTKPTGETLDAVRQVHAKYRPGTLGDAAFFRRLAKWSRADGRYQRNAALWRRNKPTRGRHGDNEVVKEPATRGRHRWSHHGPGE